MKKLNHTEAEKCRNCLGKGRLCGHHYIISKLKEESQATVKPKKSTVGVSVKSKADRKWHKVSFYTDNPDDVGIKLLKVKGNIDDYRAEPTAQADHKHIRCDIAKAENWICCICRGCACQIKPQAGEECRHGRINHCCPHNPIMICSACTPTEEGDRECKCPCHNMDETINNDRCCDNPRPSSQITGQSQTDTVRGECKIHGQYENFTDSSGCPVCEFNRDRTPDVMKTDKGGGFEEIIQALLVFDENAREGYFHEPRTEKEIITIVKNLLASQKSQIVEVLQDIDTDIDMAEHDLAHLDSAKEKIKDAIQKISGGER